MSRGKERARPTTELIAKIYQAKVTLREQRMRMSLKERVRCVIELQRACLPLLKRQRPLEAWERPWDVEP